MNNISITTTNFILKLIIFVWLLSLTRTIAIMFCGKLFEKASKGSKTALYPLLNLYSMLEIVELSPFLGILLFIPGFNLIVLTLMSYKLGKVFNASTLYKIGLIILPIVFYPLLSKSDCQYKIRNSDYFNTYDSAKNDSIQLMTQEEINEINQTPEEVNNTNEIDSIFKSKIDTYEPPEPYKAVRLDQEIIEKSEDLNNEDNIESTQKEETIEKIEITEETSKNNQSMFTSELEREEKVEFLDL